MIDKKCPVCDGVDLLPHGKYCLGENKTPVDGQPHLELSLLHCSNCGFVFASPLPSDEDINRYYATAVFWQGKMSTPVDYKFSDWIKVFETNPSLDERLHRAQQQLAYINARAPGLDSSASILDVGAGFSPFLYLCKKSKFKNLYAIEPLKDICDFLKEQGIVVAGNTIEEWLNSTPDKKYDLIIVSHTLEHLKDPRFFLSRIGKFLKKDGLLYIEVPNRDDRQRFHCGLHFLFFDINTLKLIIQKHGLEPIDVKKIKYNLMGSIVRNILLFYYSIFKSKKDFSINSPFFRNTYYNIWLKIKKIFRIRMYIYISSNDVISLSRLAENRIAKTPEIDI